MCVWVCVHVRDSVCECVRDVSVCVHDVGVCVMCVMYTRTKFHVLLTTPDLYVKVTLPPLLKSKN